MQSEVIRQAMIDTIEKAKGEYKGVNDEQSRIINKRIIKTPH